MKTDELMDRLKRHYIKPGEVMPGGVFLSEVTLGGAGGPRADAIYIGFTSTRGKIMYGFEVKTSRRDWCSEMDNPEKAEAWASQCHAWYLVVGDSSIVREGELPPDWGLMVPGQSTTRMKVVTKPTIHRDRQPSWSAFRAVVTRQDSLRAAETMRMQQAAREAAYRDLNRRVEQAVQVRLRSQPDVEVLRSRLKAIQDALDVTVSEEGHIHRRDRTVPLESLQKAGRMALAHRDLARAIERITAPYVTPLGSAQTLLKELSGALEALKQAATDHPA